MQALGVKTTVIARNKILTLADQDLIPILQDSMQKSGLDLRLKSPFNSVEKLEDGRYQVNLADGTNVQASKVLSALGRPPNVDPLCLDKAGVEVVNGAVKVDEYQNTNIPNIYAIGDITN